MRDPSQDIHKKALGRGGEKRAAQYLTSLGWRVLKTNYRTPFGEADIVAQDGDTVVFCEVKARLSDAYGSPAEAVERHKQRRYTDIARHFLQRAGQELPVRFDVLEVYPGGVNHIPAAFDAVFPRKRY